MHHVLYLTLQPLTVSMLPKLDEIDLKILSNIQQNGRMTNVELARRAGISAPPCLRRIHSLEEKGIIVNYQGNLNAASLGFNLLVFCEVTLTSQHSADIIAFETVLNDWPLVRESYVITGGADFLIKIIARDFENYQDFLTTTLSKHPLVSNIKTLMAIRSTKVLPLVPIELVTP